MKTKLLTLLLLLVGNIYTYANEPSMIVTPTSTATNNFVLYPTTNVFTFLKLDTRNGKIWQVQYSMDDNEFEVNLNSTELVTSGKPGQFALYPTTNIWTFLLLDTLNGNVWHVQWSMDAKERGIIPIKSLH